MTELHAFSFWFIYGIVITIISGIYIYTVNKRYNDEHRKAMLYKRRLEAMKNDKQL